MPDMTYRQASRLFEEEQQKAYNLGGIYERMGYSQAANPHAAGSDLSNWWSMGFNDQRQGGCAVEVD